MPEKESTTPTPEQVTAELLAQLRLVAEDAVDELLDNPDHFALTPVQGEVPGYYGPGRQDRLRATTPGGAYVEAVRTVATEEEAFEPDREWKSWQLQVMIGDLKVQVIASEFHRGLTHVEFVDDMSTVDLMNADNTKHIPDAISLIQLALKDARIDSDSEV